MGLEADQTCDLRHAVSRPMPTFFSTGKGMWTSWEGESFLLALAPNSFILHHGSQIMPRLQRSFTRRGKGRIDGACDAEQWEVLTDCATLQAAVLGWQSLPLEQKI